jgi:flavodoxin
MMKNIDVSKSREKFEKARQMFREQELELEKEVGHLVISKLGFDSTKQAEKWLNNLLNKEK